MEVLCVLKNTDTANAQDTAIRVEILDTNNNPLIQWTERDYLSTYNTVKNIGAGSIAKANITIPFTILQPDFHTATGLPWLNRYRVKVSSENSAVVVESATVWLHGYVHDEGTNTPVVVPYVVAVEGTGHNLQNIVLPSLVYLNYAGGDKKDVYLRSGDVVIYFPSITTINKQMAVDMSDIHDWKAEIQASTSQTMYYFYGLGLENIAEAGGKIISPPDVHVKVEKFHPGVLPTL